MSNVAITRADFIQLGLLAQHCDTSKLDIAVKEAVLFDMDEIFCGTFQYIDDNWNSVDEKWTNLKNEIKFDSCEDIPTVSQGAIKIICYYAYSRYVVLNNFNDSPSGSVQKTNDFSIPTSPQEVRAISNKYKAMGRATFDKMRSYITLNKDTYPEFKKIYTLACGCIGVCDSNKTGTTINKFNSSNVSKFD